MIQAEAIQFAESKWYEGRSAEEIVALQLYEERLCVPEFSIFHEAMETALKRPIQTLEFAVGDTLKEEFRIKVPNAQDLIEEMQAEKEKFICDLKNDTKRWRRLLQTAELGVSVYRIFMETHLKI